MDTNSINRAVQIIRDGMSENLGHDIYMFDVDVYEDSAIVIIQVGEDLNALASIVYFDELSNDYCHPQIVEELCAALRRANSANNKLKMLPDE